MRRNLSCTVLLPVLFLLPLTIVAQDLRVARLEDMLQPMTGRIQRLDLNHEVCALLKVLLPIEGCTFEGSIVGEVDFKTDEYWVYLPHGTKKLRVRCPGHYPLMVDMSKVAVHGVESRHIYELELRSTMASGVTAAGPAATTQPQSNMINGHEYVDLGLSVKWATCNVGASSPEEYGNYYAWGETTTKKSTYTMDKSKTYKSSYFNHDIGGDPNLDAARANWGGTWRLPTEAEFQELIDNCTWTWTTQGGHNGYKVTSKKKEYEGRSIFLPAAGWRVDSSLYHVGVNGSYWSSSPDGSGSSNARYLDFYSSCHRTDRFPRYFGRSVRPVSE